MDFIIKLEVKILIELVGVWAGTAVILHYLLFKEPSDRKKIENVFSNTKFGIKEQYPMYSWKHRKNNYTVYAYNLPYGLTDDDNPKLQTTLKKTLNKPVEIKMHKQLQVKIYDQDLPHKLSYEFEKTKGWIVPVGKSLDNYIYHDFDKTPHMTISGMTRQGKTVLLKLIMSHLIYNHPEDVRFFIIDLKGGLEFGRYENLKQVKRVASNINEAHDSLSEVLKEIKTNMSYFKQNGYTDIKKTNIRQRTFIIVDEAAELAAGKHHSKEEKEKLHFCQHALSEICRVAGALGYRNIFCTQYPTADTLPRQIKQNSDAKISFRLPTEVASRVAIDEQGAEKLEFPGRAAYRMHTKNIIQVPYIDDSYIQKELGGYEVAADKKENRQTGKDTIHFG